MIKTSIFRDASLLLLYCGLIFFLSHQPTLPLPMGFPNQDKLVHATAYAIMAIFAWRSFRHSHLTPRYTLLITIIFCSAYGVSDEFHQSFIAGRDADVWDWVADTTGASLCMLIFHLKQRQTC